MRLTYVNLPFVFTSISFFVHLVNILLTICSLLPYSFPSPSLWPFLPSAFSHVVYSLLASQFPSLYLYSFSLLHLPTYSLYSLHFFFCPHFFSSSHLHLIFTRSLLFYLHFRFCSHFLTCFFALPFFLFTLLSHFPFLLPLLFLSNTRGLCSISLRFLFSLSTYLSSHTSLPCHSHTRFFFTLLHFLLHISTSFFSNTYALYSITQFFSSLLSFLFS